MVSQLVIWFKGLWLEAAEEAARTLYQVPPQMLELAEAETAAEAAELAAVTAAEAAELAVIQIQEMTVDAAAEVAEQLYFSMSFSKV